MRVYFVPIKAYRTGLCIDKDWFLAVGCRIGSPSITCAVIAYMSERLFTNTAIVWDLINYGLFTFEVDCPEPAAFLTSFRNWIWSTDLYFNLSESSEALLSDPATRQFITSLAIRNFTPQKFLYKE